MDAKWDRLNTNGTGQGLFKVSFSIFWLGDQNCTETDPKKSQIVSFTVNLTQYGAYADTPENESLTECWAVFTDESFRQEPNSQCWEGENK